MAGITEKKIPSPLEYFITLPDEQLVLAERKHPVILCREIINIIALSIPFYLILFVLFDKLLHYPTLFISGILVVICATLSLIVKASVDWYFHLFIVTNRKILEVYFSPLYFYRINIVLLDQVRCTEIDEKKHGILNELVDMGDIVITFDRPTHEEEFILTDIQNPRKIAVLLNNMFSTLDANAIRPIWFRAHQTTAPEAISKQGTGRFSLGGRW